LQLIKNPWSAFLAYTLLRHGDESTQWIEVVNFIDELLWYIEPKINNEEKNQVTVKSIQDKAIESGLNFIHQPVIGGQISQNDIDQFSDYYDAAEKPIFAYCRTGTRSSMLWALSESGKRSIDEILRLTSAAGYNLSNLFR
jgi:uncharacterized protein (TIGR01244 family)